MFCVFLKEKAWMEMIDGTKEELLLMSQWAINDEGGRGKRLFDRLKKRLLINSFFIAPFINTHTYIAQNEWMNVHWIVLLGTSNVTLDLLGQT